MIEKAEAYRELEELNQEILRGEYFWITTKVAFMVRVPGILPGCFHALPYSR